MARFRQQVYGTTGGEDDPTAQENRLAGAVGGRRQPGSGSSIYAKGDVIQRGGPGHNMNKFLIEAKQTIHASISVKGHWLHKISEEALAAGREPALAIHIKGMESNVAERDWVAVPLSVFKRLSDAE